MGKTSAMVQRRYKEKVYDRTELQTRKGVKEAWQAHAAGRGESLTALIVRSVTSQIEQDGEATP